MASRRLPIRRVAPLADAVEEFGDDLVARDLFDRVRRVQTALGERGRDDRREVAANAVFHRVDLVVERAVEPVAGLLRKAGAQHLGLRLLQAHQDEDRTRVRQMPLDRPPAERADGLGKVDRVDFAAQVGRDLLQLVEAPRRPRPDAARRGLEQGRERLPPLLPRIAVPGENIAHALDELSDR